jgi:hypothetical protein
MGKELQVSMGVIGVLLIMFLAMVYFRFFRDPEFGEPVVPAHIRNVDSGAVVNYAPSQPTIVRPPVSDAAATDPRGNDQSLIVNPRQVIRNPRTPATEVESDVESDAQNDRQPRSFTPAPTVE